jgi:hypothetical protein
MKLICNLVVLGTVLSVAACSYPQQRMQAWKQEFQREMKRAEERRKSPEEKCAELNGVLNNDKCYAPDPNGIQFSQTDCRLRGGLFISGQCLLAPIGSR